MSDPLYRKDLLRLATDAVGAGRLPPPRATGQAHNPACGDLVTADLRLRDGHIAALAHETRACVLAQASASILGAMAEGMTQAEVAALREAVAAWLASGGAPPRDVYGAFEGVAAHAARHTCVLLPFEAVLRAFAASEAAEPAGERSEV